MKRFGVIRPAILIIASCLLCWLYASGQGHYEPFILDYPESLEKEYILKDSALFLVDTNSILEYEDILAPEVQEKFRPLSNQSSKFDNGCKGFFNDNCHTVWVKVRIKSTLPTRATFYYAIYIWYGNYQTNYIQRGQDSLEILYAGYFNPLSKQTPEQEIFGKIKDSRRVYSPITLDTNEFITVYSKLNHASTPILDVNPRIMGEQLMKENNQLSQKEQWRGLFIQGMLWMLALFNLFVFLVNRQPAYLFFVGYNLCIAIILLYVNNLKAYVFPEHPEFVYYGLTLALAALPAIYGGFLFYFLNIPKSIPRLTRFFKIIIAFSFLLTIGIFLFFTISTNWKVINSIIMNVVYASLVALIIFLYFAVQLRKPEFYFFLVANLFLFLGGAVFFVREIIIRNTAFFIDMNVANRFFEYAIIAEVLTFAAGLGYKTMHTEKEKVRLETTEKVKNRLYANITHEFRTPLTVIMGMLDNIKGHENERRLIRRNSKNVLRLINQLLDLSKLDSGTMNLDLVRGNIINYLKYLTESFESMAAEKNLSLTFNSSSEVLIMDFDEIKLQHVAYNLLSNAIKFTTTGSVNVSISEKQMQGSPFLQLKIQDSGIGISDEQMPLIFDRFFQADQTNTRKGEGTGIGLALTREMVLIMGGSIDVESKLNVGSTFIVYLPVKQSEFLPAYNPEKQIVWNPITDTSSKESLPPQHKGIDLPRLLIIEDNKDVATYIQSLLQGDYQVEVAEDGKQGIEKALETIPDIIICDVMMPEKDGYEVCQTLKTDGLTSHIPIILLTAKAEQRDKIQGLQHGADAYLMKPFDKAELIIRLQKLVELRKTLQTKYNTFTSQVIPEKELNLDEKFLVKLKEVIETFMGNPETTLENVYNEMQMSKMQLYRKLKALTDFSPTIFIRDVRLQKAMVLLKSSGLNVSEVAYEVGFNDPAYFSRVFTDKFGRAPSSIV